MQISKIQLGNSLNYNNIKLNKISEQRDNSNIIESNYTKVPAGFRYNSNITFGEFFDPNRKIPHIDYEEYMAMLPSTKQRFRIKYRNYSKHMDTSQMFDPKEKNMPLSTERNMDEFIKTASIYKKYKDQSIICLGRSPKWFLNAAVWMKDGIEPYNFIAFSGFWYWPDKVEGMRKMKNVAPNEKEIASYRKYLKQKQADPQYIVDRYHNTGKKTVITDFIATGKGMTSFLDVMADYAEDQGVLEEFSKSIQIVGIGSMQYMEKFYRDDESVSIPKVIMPLKLCSYGRNIEQTFYDMDYSMFEEMLMNQNTNECRSTYYPHETWTIYKPNRFKTGLIKDMRRVKELIKLTKNEKSFSSFTPAMFDYRNLLNFRILDGLNHRKLLKPFHVSKF